MPTPDPIPTPGSGLARRFWRLFRLLALLSALVAGIAVAFVAYGETERHIHLLVATGLGVFLMMLVGTALMTLVFLSASSGHDSAAGNQHRSNSEKDD